jgi:hypothetical protein
MLLTCCSFFCKNMFKIWRNYYHDHSVNLLPLILMYRLQYGAFFKDTFLVICNWCCTAIVAQNILYLQKLHPSPHKNTLWLPDKKHQVATANPNYNKSLSPSSNWDFILKYVLLWIHLSSRLLLLQFVSSKAVGCRLKQTTQRIALHK